MTNLKTLLGQRIHDIRKSQNITQEKLAEILNMDVTSLSKIEIGKNYPKPETLEKLATALGVEVGTFFEFKKLSSEKDYLDGISQNLKIIKGNREKLKLIYELSKSLI